MGREGIDQNIEARVWKVVWRTVKLKVNVNWKGTRGHYYYLGVLYMHFYVCVLDVEKWCVICVSISE